VVLFSLNPIIWKLPDFLPKNGEESLIFIYVVVIITGIIFAINLFSLVSWKIHQSE